MTTKFQQKIGGVICGDHSKIGCGECILKMQKENKILRDGLKAYGNKKNWDRALWIHKSLEYGYCLAERVLRGAERVSIPLNDEFGETK